MIQGPSENPEARLHCVLPETDSLNFFQLLKFTLEIKTDPLNFFQLLKFTVEIKTDIC